MLSFASHGALTLATDCAIGVLLVVWLNSAGNFFYSSARVSKIDKGTRPRNRPAHRFDLYMGCGQRHSGGDCPPATTPVGWKLLLE